MPQISIAPRMRQLQHLAEGGDHEILTLCRSELFLSEPTPDFAFYDGMADDHFEALATVFRPTAMELDQLQMVACF